MTYHSTLLYTKVTGTFRVPVTFLIELVDVPEGDCHPRGNSHPEVVHKMKQGVDSAKVCCASPSDTRLDWRASTLSSAMTTVSTSTRRNIAVLKPSILPL